MRLTRIHESSEALSSRNGSSQIVFSDIKSRTMVLERGSVLDKPVRNRKEILGFS